MKLLISVLFSMISYLSFGQVFCNLDSLRYTDRIDGLIDSIDVVSGDLPSTFDGGLATYSSGGVLANDLYKRIIQPNFQGLHQFSTIEYSALPHLGFAYSFGAQGTRFIHAKYNHAFTDKLILDIDYKKSNGLGVVRQSDFSLNDLGLQLIYSGKRYSTAVKGAFNLNTVSHSGGVLSIDSTIQQLGVEFANVQKGNANSKNKNGQIEWENYLNLLPDSVRQLGLKSFHRYTIQNRVYTEYSDTLSQLYPVININADSTRDQSNLASITNGAGVYFSSKSFSIDGIFDYRYWDFQNLGTHSDTTEIGIRSNARLLIKGVSIQNYLHFNLIGAANEFENRVDARYRLRKLNFSANYFIENKTQSPLQRNYFSNNTSYTNTLSKQTSIGFNAALDIDFVASKYGVGFFGGFTSVNNPFLYDGTTWRNDSIDFNFASFGIKGAVKLGVLHINPKIIYSISENGYLPELQALSRVYLKGCLFKAKKLEAVIGVDASYTSSYRLKAYIPYMDTYQWSGALVSSNPVTNLHVFVSLGIAEFRFFLRYENIGYFWNDQLSQEVLNYPIAGTRMRLGITWDFFN
jgi:hypothetical protein